MINGGLVRGLASSPMASALDRPTAASDAGLQVHLIVLGLMAPRKCILEGGA